MYRTFGAALTALALMLSAALAQSPPAPKQELETATFAGGCFWCVEADFDKVDGVVSTISGFMGGKTPKPNYQTVTAGGTGHFEVVQISFDPKKVTYQKLLDTFWMSIDPYDANGQFCDKGDSYRTAVFAHTPEQKALAAASREKIVKDGPLKKAVATEVRDSGPFTAAEDYHQDFYKTNPIRYKTYRYGCGRDARLEQIWGKKATQ